MRQRVLDEAAGVLGVEVAVEMLRAPALNQACFRCGLHHGFACVCTREEKRALQGIVTPPGSVTTVTGSVTSVTGSVTNEGSVTGNVTLGDGRRMCPVCGKNPLSGRQGVCSARCRKRRQRG